MSEILAPGIERCAASGVRGGTLRGARRLPRAGLLLLIAAAAGARAGAQNAGEFSLEDLLRAADGRLAVCARQLRGGAEVALNADRRYPDRGLDRLELAVACRRITPGSVGTGELRRQLEAWMTRGDPVARRDLETWCARSGRPPTGEGSPRELVEQLRQVALDVPEDASGLRDILRGLSPVSVSRDLPFHLPVLGLDSPQPGSALASAAVVETSRGPVAIAVIASGYADSGVARDLVARVGRVALGRLVPEALEEPAAVDPLELRGFREAVLTGREQAAAVTAVGSVALDGSLSESRRNLFRILEGAAVVLAIETDTARHVGVRWTLPDGTRERSRATIPARQSGTSSWSLDLKQLGSYRVELALDGHRVLDETFQVTATAPKKP
jgi:hypothetical protein